MTPTLLPLPATGLKMVLVAALLGSAVIAAWLGLPRWAPEWVVRESPFVMPAARAAVAGRQSAEFAARVAAWGAEAVPGLCRCLRHRQVEVRRLAAEVAAQLAERGNLDTRLRTALLRAADDDDGRVSASARRALHAGAPLPATPAGVAFPAPRATPVAGKAGKVAAGDEDDDDEDEDDER